MKNYESSSLPITSDCFKLLIAELHSKFKKKHLLKELPKSVQLYGYGNYDPNKPNLKTDLEHLGTDFVNGKYLYDKIRNFHKGKPIIKLSQYYSSIILLYLEYNDFHAFIENQQLDNDKHRHQLSLLNTESTSKTYYYINYYFGEDNVLLKGKTIISNNWKKIRHTYLYPQEDGSYIEHYNFGKIVRREDTVHMYTKTLLDGKLVEGASEIYYIGHHEPSSIDYLVGAYCAFDIYTHTVAGRSIFEKCSSEEDMDNRLKSPIIPSYIAMELRNKRISNISKISRHYLELSERSPYATIYNSLAGVYELTFQFPDGFQEVLKFKILNTNYKIVPLTENVYFETDRFELTNKGSILHFRFEFAGIIAFDRVNIYFKTYFLKEDSEVHNGVFSGIDNENRLVNGEVAINYTPFTTK